MANIQFTTLTSLSDELIDEIARLIGADRHREFPFEATFRDSHDPGGRATQYSLGSLAKTCRRLNQITTPHLYAALNLSDEETLLPLANTLLRNPSLASNVKLAYCLVGSYDSGNGTEIEEDADENTHDTADDASSSWLNLRFWPNSPDLNQMLQSRIATYVPNTNGEAEAKRWLKRALSCKDQYSIHCLLLPHLPNLKTLQLEHNVSDFMLEDYPTSLFSLFERIGLRHDPFHDHNPLRHLEEVEIHGLAETHPYSPDILAVCLMLPTVRRIYATRLGIDNIFQEEATELFDKLPHGIAKSLEILDTTNCSLNEPDLRRTLSACTSNLKAFGYCPGDAWVWYPISTPILQDLLQKAHMQSLEYLSLDVSHVMLDHGFRIRMDVIEPIDLSMLLNLKHLRIIPVFLWGLQAIQPPNVEDPAGEEHADEEYADTYSVSKDKIGLPDPTPESLDATKMCLVHALPPSLERLTFPHCEDFYTGGAFRRLMKGIDALLKHKTDKVPALHQLCILGRFPTELGWLDEFSPIFHRAAIAGVDSAILTAEHLNDPWELQPPKRLDTRNPKFEGWIERENTVLVEFNSSSIPSRRVFNLH